MEIPSDVNRWRYLCNPLVTKYSLSYHFDEIMEIQTMSTAIGTAIGSKMVRDMCVCELESLM